MGPVVVASIFHREEKDVEPALALNQNVGDDTVCPRRGQALGVHGEGHLALDLDHTNPKG